MSLTGIQFSENYGTGGQLSTTLSNTSVTTGHSLVVAIGSFYPITSLTDSVGNTYIRDVLEVDSAGQQSVQIWRAINVTGGANIVVTATATAPGPIAIFVQEYAATLLTLHGTKTTRGTVATANTTIAPGALGHLMPVVSWAAAVFNRATTGHTHAPPIGYTNHRDLQVVAGSFLWFNLAYDFFTSGLREPSWLCGITGSVYAAVHVAYYEAVSANFTGTPLSGASPLTVDFTDASSGDPTSWLWNFGDSSTSTSQHPSHTYTAAGVYSVLLRVGRVNVPDSTLFRPNYVNVDAAPEPPPPNPPSEQGIPTTPSVPMAVLAGSYGPMMYAWLNQPPPILTPPLPEPDLTALEVEQEILIQGLLDAMTQMPPVPGGDPTRMMALLRQASGILDSLSRGGFVRLTGQGEFEWITGATTDGDAPTSSDPGEDGDLWLEWPSVFSSRRRRMPPNPEDESPPSLWVCVLDDDGDPQWFQVETYPDGWTTQGTTGTF